MTWLSDGIVERLRANVGVPELTGTRYRLVRRIGRGGMGTVYLADDTTLARRVALKVLDRPDPHGHLAARLVREAHILARLEHPGIVPVHDVGSLPDGRFYYTMKLVRGDRLDHRTRQSGSLQERLRLFVRICNAVAFAHAHGVLHRDLKPQNIMVGPFGETLVMDWGVAKILRETEGTNGGVRLPRAPTDAAASNAGAVEDGPSAEPAAKHGTTTRSDGTMPTGAVPASTAHGSVLGTPGYMSPEQARGEIDRLDERSDVYALGAILGYLCTGDHPGAGAGQAGPVPRPLTAVCDRAMSPDPPDRYATAEELAADVARFLDGKPTIACPEGPLRRVVRVVARHRIAALLLLTYVVVRGLVLIFLGR